MHLKSLSLIAAALAATVSAMPAPDPVAVPEANAVADAAEASPSPTNPTDITGFTAELRHEPGSKHCTIEFHLPSMGCDGGMGSVMKYGDGGPEKCWMEYDGHFRGIDRYSVCSGAHASFDTNGQVRISNSNGDHARFVFNLQGLQDNTVNRLEIDPVKVEAVDE